jgi:hypothetical protein
MVEHIETDKVKIINSIGEVAPLQKFLIDNADSLNQIKGLTIDPHKIGDKNTGQPDDILGPATSEALQRLILLAQIDAGIPTEGLTKDLVGERKLTLNTKEILKDFLIKKGIETDQVDQFTKDAEIISGGGRLESQYQFGKKINIADVVADAKSSSQGTADSPENSYKKKEMTPDEVKVQTQGMREISEIGKHNSIISAIVERTGYTIDELERQKFDKDPYQLYNIEVEAGNRADLSGEPPVQKEVLLSEEEIKRIMDEKLGNTPRNANSEEKSVNMAPEQANQPAQEDSTPATEASLWSIIWNHSPTGYLFNMLSGNPDETTNNIIIAAKDEIAPAEGHKAEKSDDYNNLMHIKFAE